MMDPKTTITGLVMGIAGFLSYFNVVIPEGWITPIILVGSIALGFFAKDGKKKQD